MRANPTERMEVTMLEKIRSRLTVASAVVGIVAMAASSAAAAPGAACGLCGKNLIRNPGGEGGRGVMTPEAFGAVPGWTNEQGQFSAAAYAANFWFTATTPGSPTRGKNYLFGGSTGEAIQATATIGKQTIKLPAAAVGRKATLRGWLGNYSDGPSAQVRAEFADPSGAVLARLRIGADTTLSRGMSLRSRTGTVPRGASQVIIVVTFAGKAGTPKLAGVDDLSLVLS